MRERKDREKLAPGPLEAGRQAVRPGFDHLPHQARPRHAVDRQTVLVPVEQGRRRIEAHLAPGGAVALAGKAVRPGVEEWDPGRRAVRGGRREVVHAPEQLHAAMAKRGAEHPVAGQEDRLEVAGHELARAALVQ